MTCFRLSLAALVVVATASLGHAQSANQRADQLIARGQREFSEGHYARAIDTLRAGNILSPQPRFLYALGQAYRMNHQCKEAVKSYRDFLRSEPSRTQSAAAEANIQRCGEEDPSSLQEPLPPEPPKPPPEPVVAPVAAAVVVAVPPRREKPVYKRWWPWTILVVGLVGVGVGVGVGLGLPKSGSSFATTLPDVGPNAQH